MLELGERGWVQTVSLWGPGEGGPFFRVLTLVAEEEKNKSTLAVLTVSMQSAAVTTYLCSLRYRREGMMPLNGRRDASRWKARCATIDGRNISRISKT